MTSVGSHKLGECNVVLNDKINDYNDYDRTREDIESTGIWVWCLRLCKLNRSQHKNNNR